MKRIRHILFFVTIMLFIFSVSCNDSEHTTRYKAYDGVMDLIAWNFEENGLIALDGEWEFYPSKLISPEDFASDSFSLSADYIAVPEIWHNHFFSYTTTRSGYSLSQTQKATYRLLVKINPRRSLYSLKIKSIETPYKVWINNKLVFAQGNIHEGNTELLQPVVSNNIYFEADTSQVEIVLQIHAANYSKVGISQSILLGLPYQVTNHTERILYLTIFLLGILIIVSIYHFGLFILRPADYSTLFFGLVCLFTAVHALVVGEAFISKLLLSIHWIWIIKIKYISLILIFAFLTAFLGHLFPEEISRRFVMITIVAGCILSIILLTMGTVAHTPMSIGLETLLLLIGCFLIFRLIIAIKRQREGGIVSCVGATIFLATMVNDILFEHQIINSYFLIPFGIFILIIIQSFMLSVWFSKSYSLEQQLSSSFTSLDKIKNELLANPSHKLHISLKVIVQHLGADKGYLILENKGTWQVTAEAFNLIEKVESRLIAPVNVEDAGSKRRHPIIPDSIIRYVIDKHKKVLLKDVYSDGRFILDEYVRQNRVKSVLCFPIIHQKIMKGIIYLENNTSYNAFTEDKVRVIELISSQLAAHIDNATYFYDLELLNRTLEKKVKERTREISEKNELLQEQTEKIEAQNKMLKDRQADLSDTLDMLERQKAELDKKNKNITKSIKYAERIQQSILPSQTYIKSIIPESFTFFKPKDILSGDFYWIDKQIVSDSNNLTQIIIAVVDCTGHGVPGALLSLVGYDLLNHAFKQQKSIIPAKALKMMQDGIIERLNQKDYGPTSQDGMDISLVCYCPETRKIQFAGAKHSLYLIRDKKLQILEGDKFSMGGIDPNKSTNERQFTNHELTIEKGDTIYLFTDGYADQFGGPKLRKFLYTAFRDLLISIHQKPMEEQKEILDKSFMDWKGNFVQIDDVLVIGFKI